MLDRRRFSRYLARYLANLRAFFPGDSQSYPVENVSWKGLFIKADPDLFPKEKRFIYFEIELPEIGRIPMYGYIVHYGTPHDPGIGVEIVEVDKNFTPVWGLFIKAMNYLKEAKEEYDKITRLLQQEE